MLAKCILVLSVAIILGACSTRVPAYSGVLVVDEESTHFRPDGVDERWWFSGVYACPERSGAFDLQTPGRWRVEVRGRLADDGHDHAASGKQFDVDEVVSCEPID